MQPLPVFPPPPRPRPASGSCCFLSVHHFPKLYICPVQPIISHWQLYLLHTKKLQWLPAAWGIKPNSLAQHTVLGDLCLLSCVTLSSITAPFVLESNHRRLLTVTQHISGYLVSKSSLHIKNILSQLVNARRINKWVNECTEQHTHI